LFQNRSGPVSELLFQVEAGRGGVTLFEGDWKQGNIADLHLPEIRGDEEGLFLTRGATAQQYCDDHRNKKSEVQVP
jgi:hypothetical protein